MQATEQQNSPSPQTLNDSAVAEVRDKDVAHPTEADLPDGSIPTPRSAIEHDGSQRPSQEPQGPDGTLRNDKRLPPSKAATPHSPPESPQAHQTEDENSRRRKDLEDNDDERRHDSVAKRVTSTSQLPRPSPPGHVSDSNKRHEHSPSTHQESGVLTSRSPKASPTEPSHTPQSFKTNGLSEQPAPKQPHGPSNHQDRPTEGASHAEVSAQTIQVSANEEVVDKQHQETSDAPVDLSPKDNSGSKRKLSELSNTLDRTPTGRPQKRVKRRGTSVIVKLAKADRCLPSARMQRAIMSQDYRHPSTKKDYMHVLFLRQALESATAFKVDLSSLLSSTSKTLSTSDWEASLHEKHDCAVVKRVYDWQQRSQWPLRQPRPYPEISRPTGHWDHLLAEAKWLQTDFREERKLKFGMASQLAHWCKEWHDASASQRIALQVSRSARAGSSHPGLNEFPRSDSVVATNEKDIDLHAHWSQNYDLTDVFDLDSPLPCSCVSTKFDQAIMDRLPLFEPWKAHHSSEQYQSLSADMQRMADLRHAMSEENPGGSPDATPAQEVPPEEAGCAIWDPAWRPLRSRVNAHFAFKPPGANMPPVGFYEHRRASLWTAEEDHNLKQFAKDFPSNWLLISDRLSNRSEFTPSINRRTPWECYERLLSMEGGAYSDPGMRQYTRTFQTQIDRMRARWQSSIQQQLQATNASQQLQASPPRFPSPMRVERKPPSKRFIAIIDAARKLARKRETAETNRKQTHHDTQTQPQRPMTSGKTEITRSPQYWSSMKFKQAEESKRRQENLRQQQRALMAQGRAQQQPIYNSGLAQTVGGRVGNSSGASTTANGHLAVPNANTHRAQTSQTPMQGNMPNGNQPNGQLAAQIAMGSRNQSSLQVPQRMPPQFGNAQSMSDQGMLQYMQQQARSQTLQAQQRQISQNQMSHGSPTMGNANGAPNQSSLPPFAGSNGESMQSPRLPQSSQSNSNQTSPNMAQLVASQFPGSRASYPHQLSSGHVTVLDSLRHQIRQENPQLTDSEVMNLATSQLQKSMRDQNSVNFAQNRALSAAAGVQIPQQRQSGPQSPYMNQQSSYMQNTMLSNSMQGRSDSPANALQQHQYTQQMQAQISQQMRRNGMGSPTGTSQHQSSPPMGSAMPYANGSARTPTPGQMRPPSAVNIDSQRPGSSQAHPLSAPSPRPLSSQGVS